MTITIRCDVGEDIGLGHYYRCAFLKKAFKKKGINVCLALKCLDHDVCNLQYDLLIETSYVKEIEKYNFKNSHLILDVYHYKNHQNPDLSNYLFDLKKYNNMVAFIEGLENDECPSVYYPYIDALITPCVNINDHFIEKHPVNFVGKDFLILDEIKILKRKHINKIANKVLITFGGSDPYKQSINTLKILNKDKRSKDLEITVVVGPLMQQEQVKMIEKSVYSFKKINLQYSPKNLKESFRWADLAITNTGQTRYELAASGVPFIICPFNKDGYYLSIIFEKLKVAYLESYYQEEGKITYVDVVFDLLKNYDKRVDMSMNGKNYFYFPEGADNIVKNLIKAWT
jgi:spore coat polysaccharide biosynthesis predicted glycosyltransferase SpsG